MHQIKLRSLNVKITLFIVTKSFKNIDSLIVFFISNRLTFWICFWKRSNHSREIGILWWCLLIYDYINRLILNLESFVIFKISMNLKFGFRCSWFLNLCTSLNVWYKFATSPYRKVIILEFKYYLRYNHVCRMVITPIIVVLSFVFDARSLHVRRVVSRSIAV